MTLINDNLEGVKTALLVAIKKELTDTYRVEFGDYKTSRGDIYTKVFWSDTIRYQPKHPYCMLTPQKDISEGYDEIQYFRNAEGVLIKRYVTRSFLTVTIEVFDMGNEQSGRSSLKADNFAHKVVRQLRKYFNGDEKLDWFSGNEYYPRQIGITVDTDIDSTLDWSDTDTMFRYSFDITVGWDDFTDSNADLANGVEVSINNDTKFTVKLDNTNE
jgi:hypothetical protein